MGFSLDAFFQGDRDTHACFDFYFSNHSQNLDFKTMASKYLIFILFHPLPLPPPKKKKSKNVRAAEAGFTALLGTAVPCAWQPTQNTVIIWSGSFPVSSY